MYWKHLDVFPVEHIPGESSQQANLLCVSVCAGTFLSVQCIVCIVFSELGLLG